MNIWQDCKGKKGMISITFRTVFRGRKVRLGRATKRILKALGEVVVTRWLIVLWFF